MMEIIFQKNFNDKWICVCTRKRASLGKDKQSIGKAMGTWKGVRLNWSVKEAIENLDWKMAVLITQWIKRKGDNEGDKYQKVPLGF